MPAEFRHYLYLIRSKFPIVIIVFISLFMGGTELDIPWVSVFISKR